MEPVIRNVRDVLDGTRARLINLEDNPPTCTMTYSEIPPDGTSSHHIHEWEHEVYIIDGSGTLVCDGKEYPIKAGDAMFIPPNVDHYTLNNGGQGNSTASRLTHLSRPRAGVRRTRVGRAPGSRR